MFFHLLVGKLRLRIAHSVRESMVSVVQILFRDSGYRLGSRGYVSCGAATPNLRLWGGWSGRERGLAGRSCSKGELRAQGLAERSIPSSVLGRKHEGTRAFQPGSQVAVGSAPSGAERGPRPAVPP